MYAVLASGTIPGTCTSLTSGIFLAQNPAWPVCRSKNILALYSAASFAALTSHQWFYKSVCPYVSKVRDPVPLWRIATYVRRDVRVVRI